MEVTFNGRSLLVRVQLITEEVPSSDPNVRIGLL
jgi:hypothetical protein